MDMDNQNQQENPDISEFMPVSYRLRSRSNSMESIEEPIKIKNVSTTSVKKEETTKKSKTTKKTSKKNSKPDNLRNILKVGKRNVVPIPTTAKKNRVKRNSSERNVLDEKLVSHLHIGKKIKIK